MLLRSLFQLLAVMALLLNQSAFSIGKITNQTMKMRCSHSTLNEHYYFLSLQNIFIPYGDLYKYHWDSLSYDFSSLQVRHNYLDFMSTSFVDYCTATCSVEYIPDYPVFGRFFSLYQENHDKLINFINYFNDTLDHDFKIKFLIRKCISIMQRSPDRSWYDAQFGVVSQCENYATDRHIEFYPEYVVDKSYFSSFSYFILYSLYFIFNFILFSVLMLVYFLIRNVYRRYYPLRE